MIKRDKINLIITNIILFVVPFDIFEFVHQGGLGFFSPFRIVVMPLCLVYLILNSNKIFKSDFWKILITLLFFILCFIGEFASELSNLSSLIGNIISVCFAYFLFHNFKISRSTLYIITFWCFIQIPIFLELFLTKQIGIAQRFKGLYFDPNYLCSVIIPAIWASYYLLKIEKRNILRLYNYSILILGALMVFLSFSRGGLLALLTTIILYLAVYNRKVLLLFLLISIPVVSALFLRAQTLSWQDATNSYFNTFLYRNFTLSNDVSDLTSGRSDLIQLFVNEIQKGNYVLYGTSLLQYMEEVNNGFNSHNGFVDLCAQAGLVFGGMFCLLLVFMLLRLVLLSVHYRMIPYEVLFILGIFIPLLFLAFSIKLLWIVIGILISISNKNVFKQII